MLEKSTNLVAMYLCSLQPLSVRKRLLANDAVAEQIGIQPDPKIGVSGECSVPIAELISAARLVLELGADRQLLDSEGGEATLSKREGVLYLQFVQREGQTVRFPLIPLSTLSSDPEERIQTLDQCLREIGPTGPNFASLRHAVIERKLSETEVGTLLEALSNGVAGFQTRIRANLEAGEATLGDLIPKSLDYFEQFCGPDPGELAPEEYLGLILPDYRKDLLLRDLRKGLEICLAGSLRDDLSPGAWLVEIGDDEIWEALESCNPRSEPLSLLGALDVALYRQHDSRFRAFAEDAVVRLTAEQFPDADDRDLWQLIPSLAQFVANRINLLDNGASRAPFWKRMCALMQAAVATRLLAGIDVDLASFREQVNTNLTRAGRYAPLLDLRREPMYRAAELTPDSLQGEVVHRLLTMKERHRASGRIVPGPERIEDAAARISEKTGLPLFWAFPGPLEGHRRPEEAGNVLDKRHKDRLLELSPRLLLSNLVYLSQIFHLDAETRSSFRQMISVNSSGSHGICIEESLTDLANAATMAAAARDQELAQALALAILALAPSLQENSSVALQALLIASAAFEEENAWAEWLKEQLSRFAGLLPAGKASSRLYLELQELKKVIKLTLGITSQAEAIASAGAWFLE